MKSSIAFAKKNKAAVLIQGEAVLSKDRAIEMFEKIINAYGSIEYFKRVLEKRIIIFLIKINPENITGFQNELMNANKILKGLRVTDNRMMNEKTTKEATVHICLRIQLKTKENGSKK